MTLVTSKRIFLSHSLTATAVTSRRRVRVSVLGRESRILNLDIHNSSLNYPWVMTPLSDTLG
jgi:hypothetical protein